MLHPIDGIIKSMFSNEKKYYTIKELADQQGVSKVAIFNTMKSWLIPAIKAQGRYQISKESLPWQFGGKMPVSEKKRILQIVDRMVEEYGETFRLLAKEDYHSKRK